MANSTDGWIVEVGVAIEAANADNVSTGGRDEECFSSSIEAVCT